MNEQERPGARFDEERRDWRSGESARRADYGQGGYWEAEVESQQSRGAGLAAMSNANSIGHGKPRG